MSKIFRSETNAAISKPVRQIGIRNISFRKEVETEQTISLQDVLKERDRLLEETHQWIEQERQAIEKARITASDDINAMQAAWENEKINMEKKAYDEGFQIGYEDGRNKAIAELNSIVKMANDATKIANENAEKYLLSQERVILELAIQSASKILGQQLEEDDERFLSIIRRALKEAREMKEIKLYVSLEYFELVSNNRAELASIFPPDQPFLIFVNEDYEATECTIETNHGRIVVSIDAQLNELRESLIEILESGE